MNKTTKKNFIKSKINSFLHIATLFILIISQILSANISSPNSYVEHSTNVSEESIYFNTARLHHKNNETPQAIENYEKALECNPNNFTAHFYLANLFYIEGQNKKALDHYRASIRIYPHIPEAYFNQGVLLENEDHIDLAIESYKKSLELRPNYLKALIQIGKALKNKKQQYEAISYFSRILHIEHDNFNANYHLGKIYYELDILEHAAYYFEKAIVKTPNKPSLLTDYANILNMLNKTQDALNIYKQVLQLLPDEASANYNYAYTLKKLNRIDQAFEFYDKSLQLAPDTPYIRFGIAIAYLTYGYFIKGFKEYEWRWRLKKLKPRIFEQPLWDGSSLENKILFLHAEQGLGDTFQFIRYAKIAKNMGATVIFSAPKALQEIISLCPYIDRVISLQKQPVNFDYQAPLMSMPFLCKTTIDTIPHPIPYLYADKTLEAHWKKILEKDKNMKIGICWQGNQQHSTKFLTHTFATKSIPLKYFEPLNKLEHVSLYSLQKKQGEEQIDSEKETVILHVFNDDFDTSNGRFMDTAAVIKNLDLVITVDTSIAHLAGGLGVETWVILPEPADWRWLRDTFDSPWYPTIKLFRQKESGNWEGVIQDVINNIEKKLNHFLLKKNRKPHVTQK